MTRENFTVKWQYFCNYDTLANGFFFIIKKWIEIPCLKNYTQTSTFLWLNFICLCHGWLAAFKFVRCYFAVNFQNVCNNLPFKRIIRMLSAFRCNHVWPKLWAQYMAKALGNSIPHGHCHTGCVTEMKIYGAWNIFISINWIGNFVVVVQCSE